MCDSNLERLLAYVSGLVNQRQLLQSEHLIAENRILRSRKYHVGMFSQELLDQRSLMDTKVAKDDMHWLILTDRSQPPCLESRQTPHWCVGEQLIPSLDRSSARALQTAIAFRDGSAQTVPLGASA